MQQEKLWSYFQNADNADFFFLNAISRYKYIASYIKSKAKVLNVGIGTGGLERLLKMQDVDIYSLDPDEKAINNLKLELDDDDRAMVGYSQNIPFPDAMFDVVILSEVLEHLTADTTYLTINEIARVLKPGGKFIGTVPADEKLLDSQVACPCCGNVFHRWGHVQSFSLDKIKATISEGFGTVKVTRHYFGCFSTLNWKGRIEYFLRRFFMRFGFKGSSDSFFFVAEKAQ